MTIHLTTQANVEAGYRKLVLHLQASWSSEDGPLWQLKVEPYRIFYDILPAPQGSSAEGLVRIQAVRLKPRSQVTEDIV